MVFDKWTGNADGRQSVFLRAPLTQYFPEQHIHPQKLGFLTLMIDHGFVFNGPHWEFVDAPAYGLYMRKFVYQGVTGLEDFEPWLSRVEHFPRGSAGPRFAAAPRPNGLPVSSRHWNNCWNS